uniref:Uncharacterized protein n=1 Tax=Triticum urartu TaxID=4572 RepID=A0A8R7QAD9_TRIUA
MAWASWDSMKVSAPTKLGQILNWVQSRRVNWRWKSHRRKPQMESGDAWGRTHPNDGSNGYLQAPFQGSWNCNKISS